jgi:hypothetical protein
VAEVFGSRDDFAIEAGIDPPLKLPSAVFGHMWIWCRGVPLGNLDDRYCALYPAYCGFRDLLSGVHGEPKIDRLWAEELAGLDDVAAWNFLDGLLFGYHGEVEVSDERTVEECQRDWVVWGCFNFLTNWGEQFDGYKAFVMQPPGGPVRILSRRLPAGKGRAVEVSRDGFVTACEGFVRWFEEQELRLLGPNTEPVAAPDPTRM